MSDNVNEAEALRFEAEQIADRRITAGLPLSKNRTAPEDLVGLGLSGGGLRSAAYNLGFLQALSKCGVFRYVDYLCSVSGGGYIAGHVAAQATDLAETQPGVCFHDSEHRKLGLAQGERLDPNAYQFRHLGEYLLKYGRFFWRYLLYTTATLLLFASILGIPCTILAIIWRQYDLPLSRHGLKLVGVQWLGDNFFPGGDEALTAFLPALLFLLPFIWLSILRQVRDPSFLSGATKCNRNLNNTAPVFSCLLLGAALTCLVAFWPLCWAINYCFVSQQSPIDTSSKVVGCILALGAFLATFYLVGWGALTLMRKLAGSDGNVVEVALVLLGISLAVSLAVFLGNGFSNIGPDSGINVERRYENQSHWTWMLLAALVISLLPLAATTKLAQSAQSHSPPWKKWAFVSIIAFATVAVPFSMMFFMARENISMRAQLRPATLEPSDIKDWNAFLVLTGYDATNRAKTGEVAQQLWESPLSDTLAPLPNIPDQRALFHTILPQDDPQTTPNLSQFLEREKAQRTLLQQINRHLSADAPAAMYQRRTTSTAATGGSNTIATKSQPEPNIDLGFTKRLMDLLIVQASNEDQSVDELSGAQTFSPATRRLVEAHLQKQTRKGELAKRLLKQWNIATLHATTDGQAADSSHRHYFLTAAQRADFNRLLLDFLFPEIIQMRGEVSTAIVSTNDELVRFRFLAFWIFLAGITLAIDYNRWSPLYSHYRDELARVCLNSEHRCEHYLLEDLKTCQAGAPYPLFLATQFFLSRVRGDHTMSSADRKKWQAADAAKVHSFVFSPHYCGGEAMGRQRTKGYCGKLNLAEAVAISGAALTPLMVDNIFFSALMAAFNLRIGQWLPRPNEKLNEPLVASGLNIAQEVAASLSPTTYPDAWRRALVADGGFHDFFGLEQLLLRRCRVIIISDAGCNNGSFEFGSLADVIRMLRERHGIEVRDLDNETPPDLTLLKRIPGENKQPLQFVCLRAIYPPRNENELSDTALLVYAQMALTGREQVDLQQFRNSHPNFPDEPIVNQFFDASQVESYRQLGFHIGKAMCRAFIGEPRPEDTAALGKGLVRSYLAELQTAHISDAPRSEWRQVDHFQTREKWSAKLELDEEDFLNEVITFYLESGTERTVEDLLPLLGRDLEEKHLASKVCQILREHRQIIGRPTRAPFAAGGRRVLLRAIAYILGKDVGGIAIEFDPQRDPTMAWLAIAHLVFMQSGPVLAARMFMAWHTDLKTSHESYAIFLERVHNALVNENVYELQQIYKSLATRPVADRIEAIRPLSSDERFIWDRLTR